MKALITRIKDFIHDYHKELIFIGVFVALSFVHLELSIVYLIFEVFFVITATLAIFYRSKSKYKPAIRYYVANRLIGLLQPLATLITALVIRLSFTEQISADSILIFDIILTILSLQVFTDHFTPIRVRVATLDDVDALVEIEKQTFNEEQRASREQIIHRLETHDNTCLVAIHRKRGIVGSFYIRPVNKQDIIEHHYTHKEIQNHDDFTKQADHDALYAVGLQALSCGRIHVASYLEAALLKMAMERGYQGILGGPRLPEYHDHPEMTLDQFIHSKYAKFLRYIVKNATIPGIAKMEVIGGLENYFPDKESMNAAALVWWHTPFLWLPAFLRKPFANILYLAAVL